MRIPMVTAFVIAAVAGSWAYDGIVYLWRQAPPPRASAPSKEVVTFSATIVGVNKVTRKHRPNAERYDLTLQGAPEGQGDLHIYPDMVPYGDDEMRLLIGKDATFLCERDIGAKSCWSAMAIHTGDRRFAIKP